MTTEKTRNGNIKFKERHYAAGLIASLLFISIDKVIVPTINSGKLADAVNAQARQIARLEECVSTLRPLPTQVAKIEATLAGIEKKLEVYVPRR